MVKEGRRHTSGRTSPCCVSLHWSLACGYVRKGYFWYKASPPIWIPWSFHLEGEGWFETSPIHFCPFCGTDLDSE